jgi:hypothetical protein
VAQGVGPEFKPPVPQKKKKERKKRKKGISYTFVGEVEEF